MIKLLGKTNIQGKTIFETGPQAPAFAPIDISGLQLWLDAADSSTLYNATAGGSLVTTDGSAVARWNDKSGNNRHATQSTANARPLLKTSIKNGRNVVRFDGSNDFMRLSSVVESNPSQLTIIAAIKPSSGDCFFAHRSEQTRLIQLALYVPGTSVDFLLRGSANQIQNVSSLRFTNNTYYIVNAKFDKTNNNHQVWLNNNTSGANTTNFGNQTFTATANFIGASSTNGAAASSFGGFDLCEAIIYNTALTTTQRQAVETYLNTKWAIY